MADLPALRGTSPISGGPIPMSHDFIEAAYLPRRRLGTLRDLPSMLGDAEDAPTTTAPYTRLAESPLRRKATCNICALIERAGLRIRRIVSAS